MSRKQKSPDFYQNYPALFHPYFLQVKSETIDLLSKAGYAYYQSILHLDAIIDKQEFHRIFLVLDLQETAIKKLSAIYQENHQFWQLWQQRKTEYKEAISLEKELFKHFSEEKYTEVADKKSAFGKAAIDSLYVLTEDKNEKLYSNLLQSHQYFSLGFQIYDDVNDFREDFSQKQFNLAVYELSQKIDCAKYKDVEVLNKIFYITGVGFSVLNKSIENFEKAKAFCPHSESQWYKTIEETQNAVNAYSENTFVYIEILKKKNELKKIPQKNTFFDYSAVENSVIKNGLNFIAKEFSENYTELQHFMWLSKKEGFDNEAQLHFSDTFQRAMLNDCLIEISNKFSLQTKDFFENENQYFLERTNKDEIGAWPYFPSVKEIAADIDDLGQIMQQFILSKQVHLIDENCIKAIKTAIEERSVENGGIETWIIPKNPLTENQKTQNLFNSTKWGRGPDVEVVANFLYALFLYDSETHQETIKKGIKFIISEQDENSFWESRWYFGNFYGTYVCLRLLNCFPNQYPQSKLQALKFIENSLNEDGSFGEEAYKILSTAFARISLKSTLEIKGYKKLLEKSENFLLENQCKDGSWRAENFTKPKANQPYKSKTLTTAFVLKSHL